VLAGILKRKPNLYIYIYNGINTQGYIDDNNNNNF